MVKPINLAQVRKAKKRAEKEQNAKQNRVIFGRTKAEKARAKLEFERFKKSLDDKSRDD